MKERAYIGVTGFMTKDEVLAVLNTLPAGFQRLLMVGVLASSKTIAGQKNKWPDRYPAVDNLPRIFTQHPLALNLIHYNTKDLGSLLQQLLWVDHLLGGDFNGFQLNIAWPDPKVLEQLHEQRPNLKIVLQIGAHAFELVEHSPERLVQKIANEYLGLVNHVLLDPSGGLGQPFDPVKTKAYLDALHEFADRVGIGVAGGLGPDTLAPLKSLLMEYSYLSTDAEGKLRDSADKLNLLSVTNYVWGVAELLV